MQHSVLVNHRTDFMLAQQLLSQLPEAEVLLFDPQLLEHARNLGLHHARLQRWPGNDLNWRVYRGVREEAAALQARVDAALATLVPEAPGCQWHHYGLFYLLFTLRGYAAIGEQLAAQRPTTRLHVIAPQQAFRYGQHSFVPALALMQTFGRAGLPGQFYSYDLPAPPEEQVPDLRTAADARPELLVHLPTCFYDHAYFEGEVLASGQRALNLPSPFYDVKLPAIPGLPLEPLLSLGQRLPAAQLDRIDGVLATLRQILQEALAPLMPSPALLSLQLQALLEAYRRQLMFFESLEQAFAGRTAHQLLISNHDAGLHGPLLSHAQRHRMKVLLVPHAKFFNAPAPELPNALCLSHALQGTAVAGLSGRPVASATLAFPERLTLPETLPQPLRTLGVLLAGVSYNSMCAADMDAYLEGLRRLHDWCAGQGIDCRLRCKPTDGFASQIAEHLGIGVQDILRQFDGSLADFGAACDLCLGYDVPTSGAIELLRQGTPMVHAQLRPLLPEELSLLNGRIVPLRMLDETLAQLQQWQQDPSALWRFRRQQHAAYLQLQAEARPLRDFLG